MPERWLTEIQKIGEMEPIPDSLARAEHGPSLPQPGPRAASRAAAGLTVARLLPLILVKGLGADWSSR